MCHRKNQTVVFRSTEALSLEGAQMKKRMSFVAAMAPLLVLGCGESDPPSPSHAVRDSAGVRVVDNHAPTWTGAQGWRVPSEPRLEIGEQSGDAAELFSNVAGVVLASGDRIVVADGASGTIRLFSLDGATIGTTGGLGEGPGEYNSLAHVGLASEDTIIALDPVLQRVSVLEPNGEFVRSVRVPPEQAGVFPRPLGVFAERHVFLGALDPIPDAQQGLSRRQLRVVSMDIADGTANDVGSFLGPEELIDGPRSIAYTFGASTEVAVAKSKWAVISTDSAVFRVFDENGLHTIARWPSDGALVTQALLTAAMEARISRMPAGVSPRTIERLRAKVVDETVAPRLPVARSVVMDEDQNVWVELYPTPGAEQVEFEVFSAEGRWLGKVALPSGLKRGTNPAFDPQLEIGRDYVLGVWVDDLGVEFVRMYDLLKD